MNGQTMCLWSDVAVLLTALAAREVEIAECHYVEDVQRERAEKAETALAERSQALRLLAAEWKMVQRVIAAEAVPCPTYKFTAGATGIDWGTCDTCGRSRSEHQAWADAVAHLDQLDTLAASTAPTNAP